ncbi:hypothetical protein K438DRAFT_1982213 [Mycena galopus ATCC 62051]|nr:hypothetical protein K438DRAFT_1982213 [Mycena galopus ATCC 62051]
MPPSVTATKSHAPASALGPAILAISVRCRSRSFWLCMLCRKSTVITCDWLAPFSGSVWVLCRAARPPLLSPTTLPRTSCSTQPPMGSMYQPLQGAQHRWPAPCLARRTLSPPLVPLLMHLAPDRVLRSQRKRNALCERHVLVVSAISAVVHWRPAPACTCVVGPRLQLIAVSPQVLYQLHHRDHLPTLRLSCTLHTSTSARVTSRSRPCNTKLDTLRNASVSALLVCLLRRDDSRTH